MSGKVDFGFSDIPAGEKTRRVGEVFSAVAPYYDRMNDILSGGLHRWWKNAAAALLGVTPDMRVLDLASGSGDMAARLAGGGAGAGGGGGGRLVLADINPAMLAAARRRLPAAAALLANGEQLPFAARSFDRVIIAFGLRNVTRREALLAEIHRVLKTGGKYGILEFSPRGHFPQMQRWYLTRALPALGAAAADDAASYRYLGESILRFPAPERLTAMLADAGLPGARVNKFAAGAVCLHHGRRRD